MYTSIYIVGLAYYAHLSAVLSSPVTPQQQLPYKELYKEQWTLGHCNSECNYDMYTYCNRQDNFCQSCRLYCEDGQPYASDIDCKAHCPALFAYQQDQRTTLATQRATTTMDNHQPSTLNPNLPITKSDMIEANIASTSDSSDQQRHRVTTPATMDMMEERSPEDLALIHLLWLLLIPVIIVISVVYYFKDKLKEICIRWLDKLRNYTIAEQETASRFGTTYFELPVVEQVEVVTAASQASSFANHDTPQLSESNSASPLSAYKSTSV